MAAQPMGGRRRSRSSPGGRSRGSWLGGIRDALDGLVRTSPARFAILIFASLVLITTLLLALPIARAGERSARGTRHRRRP